MLPFISQAIPGIGGVLRTEPEDFQVEEIPAYEPSGEGEHAILQVTKRQITTQAIANELSALLHCESDSIGFAGMKDRQAVTVQRFSVPASADLSLLQNCSAQVKFLGYHNNKIRKGHLVGNRFQIRVRGANPDWHARCRDIEELLNSTGFPNFYGPQRFGREGNNAAIGEKGLKTGKLFGPKWRRWLMISALQSELFNQYLMRRLADGLFSTAIKGDIFGRLPKGGVFMSEDPSAEQPRLDNFEISPMGPIFGYKMMAAGHEALERERALLDERGIALESFRPLKAEGNRRRIRLRPQNLTLDSIEGDPLFRFELPAGTYATVFLNEFMKADDCSAEEQDADA